MARIGPVLNTTPHYPPGALSPATINGWINDLYAVPYAYCPQWKTPTEVQSGAFADCKGKAVALYSNMRRYGATNLRIVVGKRRTGDLRSHAWLEWETNNGKYLLDPTFNEMVPQAGWIDSSTYIPFYAYDGAHKYRADNHRSSYPTVVAQNLVATKYTASYRAASHGSPSWAAAQSFKQPADYARAQVQKTTEKRIVQAYQSSGRKVPVQYSQVQHPTSSPDLQRTRLAGWQHLSAPNGPKADEP